MLHNNNTTYTTFDYDYNDDMFINDHSETKVKGVLVWLYVITYSLIILLGLPLHTRVIYMITCRMERKGATILFLGLSISDLLIVLFLPFHIVSALQDFTWMFSSAMCKFCSFLMFVNMHSTALLMAFLSMVRCLSCGVSQLCFISMVLMSWFIGAILSTPTLFLRDTVNTNHGTVCRDTYTLWGDKAKAVTIMRFLSGWLCPFCVVVVSSCIVSLRRNSTTIRAFKPYGIIRAMVVAYFLCWLPYHFLMLLRLYAADSVSGDFLTLGLPVSTVLSFLNSCINPIIYIVMDRNMLWMENPFSRSDQLKLEAVEGSRSLQNTKTREDSDS